MNRKVSQEDTLDLYEDVLELLEEDYDKDLEMLIDDAAGQGVPDAARLDRQREIAGGTDGQEIQEAARDHESEDWEEELRWEAERAGASGGVGGRVVVVGPRPGGGSSGSGETGGEGVPQGMTGKRRQMLKRREKTRVKRREETREKKEVEAAVLVGRLTSADARRKLEEMEERKAEARRKHREEEEAAKLRKEWAATAPAKVEELERRWEAKMEEWKKDQEEKEWRREKEWDEKERGREKEWKEKLEALEKRWVGRVEEWEAKAARMKERGRSRSRGGRAGEDREERGRVVESRARDRQGRGRAPLASRNPFKAAPPNLSYWEEQTRRTSGHLGSSRATPHGSPRLPCRQRYLGPRRQVWERSANPPESSAGSGENRSETIPKSVISRPDERGCTRSKEGEEEF